MTSDNPRSEDPETIITEIFAGMTEPRSRPADARRTASTDRARRSPSRRRRARRANRRDRRQGPRAGPGVRGGRKVPFDDVSVAGEALRAPGRPARAGQRMSGWEPRAAGACYGRRAARERRRRRPCRGPRGARSTRGDGARSELFVGLRGEQEDGGVHTPARRSRREPGACWSRPRARRRRWPRPVRAAPSLPTPTRCGPPGVARAWRERAGARGAGDRRKRLDRQDLDEGHPRPPARALGRRSRAART